MTPTLNELLKGSTTWKHTHDGVAFILSHHAYRDGTEYKGSTPHPGIWCYYLLIPEQMYPHRWSDFACVRDPSGYESPGPAFEHDLFDTEITWSSSEPYYCRSLGRMFDAAKVGCDYAHLWHMERGYPDTYESVKQDAIITVGKFLAANPDRHFKSDFSHAWGPESEFYTAINGKRIHQTDNIPDDWQQWKPAPYDATEPA